MKNNVLAIIGAIALIIGTVLILPFISFWLSYFGGWICKITIGKTLVTALNTLFNTTYFTTEMLPWIAGALGWIGGFFKSTNHNKETNFSKKSLF